MENVDDMFLLLPHSYSWCCKSYHKCFLLWWLGARISSRLLQGLWFLTLYFILSFLEWFYSRLSYLHDDCHGHNVHIHTHHGHGYPHLHIGDFLPVGKKLTYIVICLFSVEGKFNLDGNCWCYKNWKNVRFTLASGKIGYIILLIIYWDTLFGVDGFVGWV